MFFEKNVYVTLQSEWQVGQTKDKRPRPLGDVIQERSDKVINAAVTLQQQLADSAERPAASCVATAEQPSSAVSAGEDPTLLTELKRNQQKRAIESVAEEQRRRAKPKAAKGQNKRTVNKFSDSSRLRRFIKMNTFLLDAARKR